MGGRQGRQLARRRPAARWEWNGLGHTSTWRCTSEWCAVQKPHIPLGCSSAVPTSRPWNHHPAPACRSGRGAGWRGQRGDDPSGHGTSRSWSRLPPLLPARRGEPGDRTTGGRPAAGLPEAHADGALSRSAVAAADHRRRGPRDVRPLHWCRVLVRSQPPPVVRGLLPLRATAPQASEHSSTSVAMETDVCRHCPADHDRDGSADTRIRDGSPSDGGGCAPKE